MRDKQDEVFGLLADARQQGGRGRYDVALHAAARAAAVARTMGRERGPSARAWTALVVAGIRAEVGHHGVAEATVRAALALVPQDAVVRARLSIALAELVAPALRAGEDEAAWLLDEAARLRDGAGNRAESHPQVGWRLLAARGRLAAVAGRYGDADHLYRRAAEEQERATDRAADRAAVLDLQRRQAHVLLVREQHEEARDALRAGLDRCGDEHQRLSALFQLDLAAVESTRGATRAASTALDLAEDLLAGLTGPVPYRDLARYHDARGTVARAGGDLTAAAAAHREALRLLDAADQADQAAAATSGLSAPPRPWSSTQRAGATVNLGIDHLLERRVRYVREGARLLDEARSLLRPLARPSPDLARCTANLGVAHAMLGDAVAAGACFRDARRHYLAEGRYLDVASMDHNLSCLVGADATDDELAAALRLVVPVALVRDAARFRVPDGDNRRQWWAAQARQSYTQALRLAARLRDDGQRTVALADLVWGFRTSGLVGVTAGRPRTEGPVTAVEVVREPPDTSAPANGLLAPRRGPTLIAPDGRTVLADHLVAADASFAAAGPARSDRICHLP